MSTRKVIIYKGKLYFSDVTVPTRVSQLANDAGYVTTDEKVKQTPTTSGGPYRILLSNDTDDTEHIDKVRKSSSLIYYPSGVMELTGTILGTETCKTTIQSYNIRINVTDEQNISKYMDIWNDDISLSGNTWDGTHGSLKTTIGELMKNSITISKLYTVSLTTKSGVIGGYVGEINLTDVPSKCVLILPIGNARCATDGGRYGVVGSYSPSNPKNTRWFINGPTSESYNVYFVYFSTFI